MTETLTKPKGAFGPVQPHRTMLGVLRILAALLFLEHSTKDLLGLPYSQGAQAVMLLSLTGAWKASEALGATLILLGFCTRPIAMLMMIDMILVYMIKFLPNGPFPLLNHGESAVLLAGIFAFLAAVGPGRWSLGDLIQRQRAVAAAVTKP